MRDSRVTGSLPLYKKGELVYHGGKRKVVTSIYFDLAGWYYFLDDELGAISETELITEK